MLYGNYFDENYEFSPENSDILAEVGDLLKRDEETSETENSSCTTRWSGLFRQATKETNRSQVFPSQSENDRIIGDYLDYCPTQLVNLDDQLFEAMEEEEPSDENGEVCSEEISSIECSEILNQIFKIKENDPIDAELIGKFVSISCKQLNDCLLENEHLLSEESLTDGIVIRWCEDLTSLEQQLSLSWTVAFIDLFILKKVKARHIAPSRAFLTAVTKFSEKYPRAVVEGLMIPCITDANCTRIQMDVLKHIFAQSTSQDIFLKKFFEQYFVWTESVVAFLNVCVDTRSDVIYEDVLDSLVTRISDCTRDLENSLIFSKFLNVMVTKLRARISPDHVSLLTAVVNKTKSSYLKKSCLSKLKSINK